MWWGTQRSATRRRVLRAGIPRRRVPGWGLSRRSVPASSPISSLNAISRTVRVFKTIGVAVDEASVRVSLIRLGVIGVEPYGVVGTHPIGKLGDLRGLFGYWCTRRSDIGPGSGGIMRLCGG